MKIFVLIGLLWLFSVVSSKFALIDIYNPKDIANDSTYYKIPAATSLFGPSLPSLSKAPEFQLLLATPIDGCTPIITTNTLAFALLIERGGGCSFETKVLHAQAAGAQFAIIMDTVDAIYQNPQPLITKYNCEHGTGTSISNVPPSGDQGGAASDCASSITCASKRCILTGKHLELGYQVCCLKTSYINMQGEEFGTSPTIPSVFVSIDEGQRVSTIVSSKTFSVAVKAYLVPEESPWNVSMFLIWFLGVCVVMGGSLYSASRERLYSQQIVLSNYLGESHTSNPYKAIEDKGSDRMQSYDGDEPLHLNAWHAIGFLLMSSGMLLLLYYVHILYFVNLLFMFSAILSFTVVIAYPAITYVWITSENSTITTPFGDITMATICSLIPSIILGLFWFIERQSTYAWILQDLFGICLCFVFFAVIHISSLRVATILLTIAFIYDVFFVYISPYIFGDNVMVAVASSGGNVKIHSRDFCSLYPTSPECSHKETMPLIIRIPLLFSDFGGEAMLGLGDIVLPGLVVSFAVRYDYCMGYPISKNYFMVTSIAYASGLLLANIMAVELRNIVAGQPALMYIVPILLATFLGYAYKRVELEDLWDGPECLGFQEPSDIIDEKEAFLSK